MSPSTESMQSASPSFEEVAAEVLRDLQSALAELVAALPGRNARAVDLQRTLDLDKKLGWQLFTFVSSANPLEEIANVPGAPSMRRILNAAGKRRVPGAVSARAAEAFEAFEVFVAEHGGDREGLVSLARGLSADVDRSHELRVRKSVFRGLAHVWGVRAAAMVRTAVIHPSPPGAERSEDVLVVVGHIGVQRLRRDAPFALSATLGAQSNPGPGEGGAAPIENAASGGPVIGPMEALREFSSSPLPKTSARSESAGDIETELVFPPSGRVGAVTLFTAQRISAAWTGAQAQHGLNSLVKIPTETYICELLVPEGWTDPGTARVGVYGRRGAVERVHDLRPIDLLPQHEILTCVGGISAPTPLPQAPRHHEAVASMLARLEWTDVKYDLYRCVVEYPVLHTMIRIAADAV